MHSVLLGARHQRWSIWITLALSQSLGLHVGPWLLCAGHT